jgi:non-specific protein-tyrosine kinase
MVKLLAALRGRYDVVLIDTAPLLPVTDAAVLAPRADGVLVLVRHGRTVVQDVQAAKDALHAVSGRVIGSVMTMVSHGTRAHTRFKPGKGRTLPRSLGQVPADPSPRPSGDTPGGPPRSPGGSPDGPPRPPAEGRPAAPAPAPRQPVAGPRPPVAVDGETKVLDRGGSTAR